MKRACEASAIPMEDCDQLPGPEAQLISRCQAGDTASFDLLVGEHYQLAYNIAYRMLGDPDRAADATQNAFIRAFRALKGFRAEASFSTWLYRIVTNVCLDEARQASRRPASLTLVADDEATHEQRDVPDQQAAVTAHAEQHQRQQVVHRAIQRLSPEHRAVIILYDLNGFSYQEVGQMLDVPVGTVKSRLNRARLNLKDELKEHLELFE